MVLVACYREQQVAFSEPLGRLAHTAATHHGWYCYNVLEGVRVRYIFLTWLVWWVFHVRV